VCPGGWVHRYTSSEQPRSEWPGQEHACGECAWVRWYTMRRQSVSPAAAVVACGAAVGTLAISVPSPTAAVAAVAAAAAAAGGPERAEHLDSGGEVGGIEAAARVQVGVIINSTGLARHLGRGGGGVVRALRNELRSPEVYEGHISKILHQNNRKFLGWL